MGHELTGEPAREERRNQVLLAYVEALEAGREPDRGQLLAAHPDLRQDLEAFLAGHDEVARLTAPLRAAGRATPAVRSARLAMGRTPPLRASASSATSASCARWAGAGWGSSTRPSRSRSGGGSR